MAQVESLRTTYMWKLNVRTHYPVFPNEEIYVLLKRPAFLLMFWYSCLLPLLYTGEDCAHTNMEIVLKTSLKPKFVALVINLVMCVCR